MTDTRITDFEAVAPMPIYTQADLDAAVQKEREACAMICEFRRTPGTGSVAILNGAADAIRARSPHD